MAGVFRRVSFVLSWEKLNASQLVGKWRKIKEAAKKHQWTQDNPALCCSFCRLSDLLDGSWFLAVAWTKLWHWSAFAGCIDVRDANRALFCVWQKKLDYCVLLQKPWWKGGLPRRRCSWVSSWPSRNAMWQWETEVRCRRSATKCYDSTTTWGSSGTKHSTHSATWRADLPKCSTGKLIHSLFQKIIAIFLPCHCLQGAGYPDVSCYSNTLVLKRWRRNVAGKNISQKEMLEKIKKVRAGESIFPVPKSSSCK